jgi:murein DD-endopeptidase MepM/ murein hydrolase activator NlpD
VEKKPVSGSPEPPPSGFTQALARANGLDERGFVGWQIDPAMRFGAARMWWADRGPRPAPHEGLDLCFYRDRTQAIHRLDPETRIPAAYDGSVVRLCDDFVGRSVMMAHRFPNRPGWYYTLYGHTRPREDLEASSTVRQGEIVARLAPVTRPGSTVLPHLHISLGWSPHPVPPERLDWPLLPEVLHLLDPLPLLS